MLILFMTLACEYIVRFHVTSVALKEALLSMTIEFVIPWLLLAQDVITRSGSSHPV